MAQLTGGSSVTVEDTGGDGPGRATVVLSTEDARFARDPQPLSVGFEGGRVTVEFRRPGAIIVRFA